MSFYMLLEVKIIDKEAYESYLEQVRPIFARFKGRLIVSSDKVRPHSGHWDLDRITLLSFPSEKDFHDCFNSPDYKAIRDLRIRSAELRTLLFEE